MFPIVSGNRNGPKAHETNILSGVFMKKKSKQAVVKPVNQKIVNVATLLLKERDGRLLAVGTVITKTHHGQTIEVKVLENGFEYQGKTYKSISRVAMEIVKRPISGYVFFGLSK